MEERCGIVEDEVDTSPLLHHLERGAEDGLAQIGVGLEERAAEAVHPPIKPAACRNERPLVFLVGDDLSKFGFDVLRLRRLTTKLAQRSARLLNTSPLDEETWRVGEEQQTDAENQTPSELDGDWNAERSTVLAVLHSVVDNRCQHDANGDTELVPCDQGASDFARADLRHVQDDNGSFETDTNTRNQTTGDDQAEASGHGDLENHT